MTSPDEPAAPLGGVRLSRTRAAAAFALGLAADLLDLELGATEHAALARFLISRLLLTDPEVAAASWLVRQLPDTADLPATLGTLPWGELLRLLAHVDQEQGKPEDRRFTF